MPLRKAVRRINARLRWPSEAGVQPQPVDVVIEINPAGVFPPVLIYRGEFFVLDRSDYAQTRAPSLTPQYHMVEHVAVIDAPGPYKGIESDAHGGIALSPTTARRKLNSPDPEMAMTFLAAPVGGGTRVGDELHGDVRFFAVQTYRVPLSKLTDPHSFDPTLSGKADL